jgi:hypothetical protein
MTDEQADDVTGAAPTPRRRRRRWPWILVGLLVVLPALVIAAWTAITLNYSYSRGERAGYIQKLSQKGWICKTWEGELAMVNMPGAAQEKFPFTVRSDSIAKLMTGMMGSRVAITYEEHRGVPGSCFGETNYYVTNAKAVQ